jgi:glutathione synthase/RimK-type ligase-like ATP-grasp enzyme
VNSLGLHFGAIDLIRTKNDGYTFLEINPNGQWAWLDIEMNLGIADAIIDQLK